MNRLLKMASCILLASVLTGSLLFFQPAMASSITKDEAFNVVLYTELTEFANKKCLISYNKGNMADALFYNTICTMALDQLTGFYYKIPLPYSMKVKLREKIKGHEKRLQANDRLIKDKINERILFLKNAYARKTSKHVGSPQKREAFLYGVILLVIRDNIIYCVNKHNSAGALFYCELKKQIIFEVEGLTSKTRSFNQKKKLKAIINESIKNLDMMQKLILELINVEMKILVDSIKKDLQAKAILK